MKFSSVTLFTALLLLISGSQSSAHFGMIVPQEPRVTPENRTIQLSLSFSHPFEEIGMDLIKPAQFYVIKDNEKTNLLSSLQEIKIMDHLGWQADYQVKRPGVYHFIMEPVPYWEPTEELSIIHYTKVIIPAFGSEEGWDQPVGLATEIVPRLRPFGNYAGNSFTAQVLLNGKPLPEAEVEVEFYNQKQQFKAASDLHITQVVKADAAGIFTFSCPLPGWWGFAALSNADYKLKNPQGEDKEVELGAVLWIYMDSYKLNQHN
jgi:nickel transport protein